MRATLSEREAQVRLDTAAVYPLRAWRAAQRRLYAAPREPRGAVPALGALRCVSASYATEVLALEPRHHAFAHGKRILLPATYLRKLDTIARADGADEGESFAGGGMNFSLTAPNGARSFCGVFFDSPSDELVVAPDWVLHRYAIPPTTARPPSAPPSAPPLRPQLLRAAAAVVVAGAYACTLSVHPLTRAARRCHPRTASGLLNSPAWTSTGLSFRT